jgi:O-antigen biosynthesis protein WbqP
MSYSPTTVAQDEVERLHSAPQNDTSRDLANYERIKRVGDVLLSLVLFVLLMPAMFVIAICIKLTSRGPVLHWSKRVGRENLIFMMPKFRSMRFNTPQVATHLLHDPQLYLTPVGAFLRKTSLDELPQLLSILRGDISFVGPRPALFNQDDLVALRTQSGIHRLMPGLTGWAQINGRDELSIQKKVELDRDYLHRRSVYFDLRILLLTFLKAFTGTGVSH